VDTDLWLFLNGGGGFFEKTETKTGHFLHCNAQHGSKNANLTVGCKVRRLTVGRVIFFDFKSKMAIFLKKTTRSATRCVALFFQKNQKREVHVTIFSKQKTPQVGLLDVRCFLF
jgi:hypothetical protein